MKTAVNYYSKNVKSFPEINKKNSLVLQTQLHSLMCYYPYPHPQRHEMSLAAYPEYQHLWMFYIKGEIEGPLSCQLLSPMCIFIKYMLQFSDWLFSDWLFGQASSDFCQKGWSHLSLPVFAVLSVEHTLPQIQGTGNKELSQAKATSLQSCIS